MDRFRRPRHGDMVLLLSLLMACTSANPRHDSLPPITLELVAETSDSLSNPASIAVTRGGRIFLGDRAPVRVLEFDASARVLRSIGTEGEGPGEFRSAIVAATDSRLAVHDPDGRRLTLFDSTGTLLWSVPAPCCREQGLRLDEDGHVHVPGSNADQARAGWDLVHTYDPNGIRGDSILVPGSTPDPSAYWTLREPGEDWARFSTRIPFTPKSYWALSPEGLLIHGFLDQYRVAEGSSVTDTQRVTERAWHPVPIPDSVRTASVESAVSLYRRFIPEPTLRELFRLADVPTTYPAFHDIQVDPCERLWVLRSPRGDQTVPEWDLFSRERTLVATVRAAAPTLLVTWAAGSDLLVMVGIRETGEPVLQVHRVPSPASAPSCG